MCLSDVAPATCGRRNISAEHLPKLDYVIVGPLTSTKRSPGTPVDQFPSAVDSKIGICQYTYKSIDLEKDEEHPKSLITAVCNSTVCRESCREIFYDIPILKRNKRCDRRLGIRTWRLATKRIVIGFEL